MIRFNDEIIQLSNQLAGIRDITYGFVQVKYFSCKIFLKKTANENKGLLIDEIMILGGQFSLWILGNP